ncbi:ABC transporter ATP-binding protein [Paenibacillus sp. HB172176]|uniref:ABC transporter ATP-binding protein n=1 Tax=Paenibacillus sp. HB172176 TaxID=2493690 RepID=UPI00143A5823|nr:ABC transporter ATP-binding protein [Paenibacillus sp. HB172176]
MIHLSNISKKFQWNGVNEHVLKEVKLNIQTGDFVTLMGTSGSGKTTLLNLIGLLDSYDKGEYVLNDISIGSLNRSQIKQLRTELFGYIFQKFHLIADLTALENVEMPLGYSNWKSSVRKERALECLTAVGLKDHCNKKPNELSGGQQQRVAIARAIVKSPKILLADEPTGNLDEENTQTIISLLKDINIKSKCTLIIATHDKEVAQNADYGLIIRDGLVMSPNYSRMK